MDDSSQMSSGWQFESELTLENFVWSVLPSLLGLTPLKRQYWVEGQVCDILAVDEQGQLAIIELKNAEDRYVVQQLTRYYHAIVTTQSMAEQINEALPIRLIAIAPSLHPHNLIDQEYCQLKIELMIFTIQTSGRNFTFHLTEQVGLDTRVIPIPDRFHQHLFNSAADAMGIEQPAVLPPPRSLRRLLENLSSAEVQFVLSIREKILSYSDRMIEIGRSTTTQYGLKKGERDIYKTKICAEFRPLNSRSQYPRLRLRLPYPKKQKGGPANTYLRQPVKGLAWVEISINTWCDQPKDIQLYFYLGKGNRYSYSCNIGEYSKAYTQLTGGARPLSSLSSLVSLALDEWHSLSDSHG
ncbi:endonuclease NucS domain-containing protein [Leptolyngbya sp. AN02str]|uniref:endonuclease NucS domain-containing protein n=1 Tax=Leptolyngbya sp. AN02str TaxID=3423363 RepID=UPI003D3206D7